MTADNSVTLTPQAYIQHIQVMFQDLMTQAQAHDVALDHPDDFVAGYAPSPTEADLFPPTALRQIGHFYRTYLHGVTFLAHPTLAFGMNRTDATRSHTETDSQFDPTQGLALHLQQTRDALDRFHAKTDPGARHDDGHAMRDYLATFQEQFATITQQFCHDNQIDILARAPVPHPHIPQPRMTSARLG